MTSNSNPTGLCALLGLCIWASAAVANVSREDILILADDGQSFTAYKTLRSDLPKRQVTLDPEETVKDLLYFQPDNFAERQDKGNTMLSFDGGSYALMRTGKFAQNELKSLGGNVYQFNSWDGKTLANGHFGKWNTPGPFARLAYVWVVPESVEIMDYNANKGGTWQRRGNTLAWIGKNVNDVTFDIKYKVNQESVLPEAVLSKITVSEELQALDEPSRITFASGTLFPSGSHKLTAQGERRLTELAQSLGNSTSQQIIVEGHTDNQPLKPYLRETYPSNWELSAARATNVVRWLAEHGVSPKILEARAYGEQRPLASNSTAEGRAKNRRIEILINKLGGSSVAVSAAKTTAASEQPAKPEKTATPGSTTTPINAESGKSGSNSGFIRKPE